MRSLSRASQKCFSMVKSSSVDDYEITGLLGQGSTSRVFQGYNILDNREVIIKLFKNIPDSKIKREIRTNQLILECNNIIPLLDVVRDDGCQYYGLIFKNFKGVTLNHLVGKIGFKQGVQYAMDLLRALQCIHSKGVVHRDMKSSNILITKEGAKLFDFGLSRIQNIDEFKTTRFGTKCYYSPEVMFQIPIFTNKIDIWLLGVIIAQMLVKRKPLMPYKSDEMTTKQIVFFSGYDPEIVRDSSLKNIRKINWYEYFNTSGGTSEEINDAIQVVKAMLQIKPQNRPSASQLLQYPLFNKFT